MDLTFKEVQNASHETCGKGSYNNCGNQVTNEFFARSTSLAWKEIIKVFGFPAH
jgi:hypothetical protein